MGNCVKKVTKINANVSSSQNNLHLSVLLKLFKLNWNDPWCCNWVAKNGNCDLFAKLPQLTHCYDLNTVQHYFRAFKCLVTLDCRRLVTRCRFLHRNIACKRNNCEFAKIDKHLQKNCKCVLQDDCVTSCNLKGTGFGGFQCNNLLYFTWISFKSLSWIFCKGSMKFCLTSMSRASLTSPSSRMASPTSIRATPVKHKSMLYVYFKGKKLKDSI